MPDQEILNYINQARSAGQSDEQIKQALRASGWGETEINEAFGGSVSAPTRAPLETAPVAQAAAATLPWKIIITAIAGVLVIGAGAYFLFGSGDKTTEEISGSCDFSKFSKDFSGLKSYPGSKKLDEKRYQNEFLPEESVDYITCSHNKSVEEVWDYFTDQFDKGWLTGFREGGAADKEAYACRGDKQIGIEVSETEHRVGFYNTSPSQCSEDNYKRIGYVLNKSDLGKSQSKSGACDLSKYNADLEPYPNSILVGEHQAPFNPGLFELTNCISVGAKTEDVKDYFVNQLKSKGWSVELDSQNLEDLVPYSGTGAGTGYEINATKGSEKIGMTIHFAGYSVGRIR